MPSQCEEQGAFVNQLTQFLKALVIDNRGLKLFFMFMPYFHPSVSSVYGKSIARGNFAANLRHIPMVLENNFLNESFRTSEHGNALKN
jgi:hypothetical protein